MKAVVNAKREPDLWLEDVPVPEIGGDDVLTGVLKASICGRINFRRCCSVRSAISLRVRD
jgi:hypothetical protein